MEEVLSILKPETEKSFWSKVPFIGDFAGDMRHAGLTMNPGTFFMGCVSLFILFTVIALTFTTPTSAVALGFGLFIFLPIVLVRNAASKRMDKLVKQLPDTLDLMARGLKVGHPLNSTLSSVANEMPDPIGSEFGIVVDQVSYGEDLTKAIDEMAERVDQEDMHYLAAAIMMQHGTGGDLARVLSTLGKVIRARIIMRRKIQAVSAEGRLSAIILSLIPVVIFGMMMMSTPGYYMDVADDPLAVPTAVIVVFFVVANALALRKLVNFRV